MEMYRWGCMRWPCWEALLVAMVQGSKAFCSPSPGPVHSVCQLVESVLEDMGNAGIEWLP